MNSVLDPKTEILKLGHSNLALACHNSKDWSKFKRNNRLIFVTGQNQTKKSALYAILNKAH